MNIKKDGMTNIQYKELINPRTLEVAEGVFDVVVKRADGSSVSLLDDVVVGLVQEVAALLKLLKT